VDLDQLLKKFWLSSWTLIIPLAIFASFTDLLLLGGIRLFLAIITDSLKELFNFSLPNFNWLNFNLPNFSWLESAGILHWLFLMLALIGMRYLAITLRVRSEERFNHKLESHLRIWWIRTVKNLHPLEFHSYKTESILHNANNSVSAMPKGCKVIIQSIQAISQLVFFVPVLFLLSWQLTLMLLFIFAPVVLLLQKSLKRTNKDVEEFNILSGKYNFKLWIWENLRKNWNNQSELSKYLTSLFNKIRSLRDISVKMCVRDATIMQNIETLSIFIMCAILAICAVFIQMNIMESFQIILFCAALFICYKPLKECSNLISNLRDFRLAHNGLNQLKNLQPTVKFIEEQNEECIRIENMAFKYGDSEPWIFEDLNNVIRLNRPLLLQGDNGKGKTTLLRILSGLEIPQGGNIYMPPKASAGSFYFSQRLVLPPVRWLEQEINQKKCGPAMQKFFEVLGLKTLLNKNGHSNGELQRIGLAWAVVSGAPFLFLDEPFAFISQDLREPIFKAFWNTSAETDQWWMMASHDPVPQAFQEKVVYWKL
jgi:ABC-type multidrug transport system fused ATPase/permease subunit